MGRVGLTFKDLRERELGSILHGYIGRLRYAYIKRFGYGTFDEGNGTEISDIESTHKLYLNLGGYYTLKGDINLKMDLSGGWHKNVDRNSGVELGNLNTEHGVIPGYFRAEFYHNRYATARVRLGVPAGFWGTRIEPGFNVLYMPGENEVVGVEDYAREVYKSVSVGIMTKIANLIPILLDYGYGIDADRKGEIGSHEIRALVLMGFGKIKTDKYKG
jgi:hypothetical protein